MLREFAREMVEQVVRNVDVHRGGGHWNSRVGRTERADVARGANPTLLPTQARRRP
jgi:hypothetical protein